VEGLHEPVPGETWRPSQNGGVSDVPQQCSRDLCTPEGCHVLAYLSHRICMVFSEEPNMSDSKAEFLKDYLHQDRRAAAVSSTTTTNPPASTPKLTDCCMQVVTLACAHTSSLCATPGGGRGKALLAARQSKARTNGPGRTARNLSGWGPAPGGKPPRTRP